MLAVAPHTPTFYLALGADNRCAQLFGYSPEYDGNLEGSIFEVILRMPAITLASKTVTEDLALFTALCQVIKSDPLITHIIYTLVFAA